MSGSEVFLEEGLELDLLGQTQLASCLLGYDDGIAIMDTSAISGHLNLTISLLQQYYASKIFSEPDSTCAYIPSLLIDFCNKVFRSNIGDQYFQLYSILGLKTKQLLDMAQVMKRALPNMEERLTSLLICYMEVKGEKGYLEALEGTQKLMKWCQELKRCDIQFNLQMLKSNDDEYLDEINIILPQMIISGKVTCRKNWDMTPHHVN